MARLSLHAGLLAGFTALASTWAVATLAAPHERKEFVKDYDGDGDGTVTEAEYQAERDRRFKETDANRDGVLTEAEYVAEYEKRLDKQLKAQRERQMKQAHSRFGALDQDANRKMTHEEYIASGWRMYGRHDADLDGKVTEKEDDADTAAPASAQPAKAAEAKN